MGQPVCSPWEAMPSVAVILVGNVWQWVISLGQILDTFWIVLTYEAGKVWPSRGKSENVTHHSTRTTWETFLWLMNAHATSRPGSKVMPGGLDPLLDLCSSYRLHNPLFFSTPVLPPKSQIDPTIIDHQFAVSYSQPPHHPHDR